MPYAVTYASIYIVSCIFNVFNVTMNNIVTSEGAAKTTMLALVAGAILNIGLDPVFIYVLDMGVAGAAIATAISQMVYCILCDLRIDIDDIFKWNHIPIYKGRFRNDSCRNAVITNKRYFIHIVWILYCIFLVVPCTWKRIGRIYSGSLPTRYLFCTSYFDTSCILGYQRYSLCTTDCRRTFCNYYNIYGITFTQRISINKAKISI